ncbi:DUF6783 domain-containing protein [uncultured Robinsoniella sp.]|uniref:DUF6783 domain-containing protein n=1 Tax=uncultured Robinsoniella sp. TaxID=904190 RepID=UPI00374F210A
MRLKNYYRYQHAPLCGIFDTNSAYAARCVPFIPDKSYTNGDTQLTESNFKTLYRVGLYYFKLIV